MSGTAVDSRTWRRGAVAVVAAADLVVLLAGAATLGAVLPFAALAVLVLSVVAARRPGGNAGLALLLAQVATVTATSDVPRTVVDWALATAAGMAVLATHLALALLAGWPVRAELPRATLARWVQQGAVLALLGVGAAVLGLAATATPMGWGPWATPVALGLVAALAFAVGLTTRRG